MSETEKPVGSGAIMQLVANGVKDMYLHGNPQNGDAKIDERYEGHGIYTYDGGHGP